MNAAATFPLTSAVPFGNSVVPQNRLGVSVAFAVPHTTKRADFLVSCHHCTLWPLWAFGIAVTYWRNNVLMFVRLRRPSRAGERCSAFFCAQSQNRLRCVVLRFFLSSRFLRFRYRLSSFLTRSIRKAAVVAFLGLMLAFSLAPELFIAGGAR